MADHDVVQLPTALVGDLLGEVIGELRGRNSRKRRQRFAVAVSSVLHRHAESMTDESILALLGEVSSALNDWTRSDADDLRAEFDFDQAGNLCWTSSSVARSLGFEDRTAGLKYLRGLRARGEGPPYVKTGDAAQSHVLYPVRSTLRWLKARQDAAEAFAMGGAA